MSTEEIINAWKNNEDDPNKLSKGKKTQGKLKQKGKTPANPAGEKEITDEELKAVEGGLSKFTCDANSC
ncbi:MAG TPA: mersacidin/lichenicidin family type 2 lantibiotic [Ktedonobacteraceae bacterium]|nr:mersacidin/lichenicidin family type 2 lantibiotic [Ktedonobacteraceae bacterium]